MKIRVKKLNPDAVIPAYAMPGDAGMDLTATSKEYDMFGNVVYGTGLAMEIPAGYVGLLFPRSSVYKKDLLLSNAVGVIDSGYRGEISLKFNALKRFPIEYEVGDRVGQIIIIPYPQIEFEEASELSHTDRGVSGYGSTGE